MPRSQPRSVIRHDARDSYFNYNLRFARHVVGYTMDQLAGAVGITVPTVASYERLRSFPEPQIAEKIAGVLGKKRDELFPGWLKELIAEVHRERKGHLPNKIYHHLKCKVEEGNANLTEMKEYQHLSVLHPSQLRSHHEAQLVAETDVFLEVSRRELRERLPEALTILDTREREILERRYGLKGECQTLEVIGKQYKITRERVRQIERKTIEKLRVFMETKKRYFVEFLN